MTCSCRGLDMREKLEYAKQAASVKKVCLKFYHGLGDCVNFAHQIPLYIKRGYQIEVECSPDKAVLFEAAGAKIVPRASLSHNWFHAGAYQEPQWEDSWNTNKAGWNLTNSGIMPNIGTCQALWDEYLDTKLHIASDDTLKRWQDVPRPIILLHTVGNTSSAEKSYPHDLTAELYRQLLDKTNATIILLDWDNRVSRWSNARIRHIADEFGPIDLKSLVGLLTQSSLFIGVDSGPLHLCRLASLPAIGLWHKHSPWTYFLPREKTLNICKNEPSAWVRRRRRAFNILDYGGDYPPPDFVATQAARILSPRTYVDCAVGDCLVNHLINKTRTDFDRQRSFSIFFKMMRLVKNPVVVETGCIRAEDDWTAGFFSYICGIFLKYHGGKLYSVDLNNDYVNFARNWTNGTPVEVSCSHSHKFLEAFDKKIDFLYLDSADTGTPGYQECCLEEAKLALHKLSERAAILIDDTYWRAGWQGKGARAIPWLVEQGFTILYAGYQVLLTRHPEEFSGLVRI